MTSTRKHTTVALYCRVSTAGQTAENQRRELVAYAQARGWQAVEYSDVMSGASERRPGLDALMKDGRRRKFSAVVAWSLDRMGRSLPHLVTLIAELESLGIAFVSLKEGVDLSTAAGKLQCTSLPRWPASNANGYVSACCVDSPAQGLKGNVLGDDLTP